MRAVEAKFDERRPPTPDTDVTRPPARSSVESDSHLPASPLPSSPQPGAPPCTIKLLFTVPGAPASTPEAPPAFFPLQRVTFSPSLKVVKSGGMAVAAPLRESAEETDAAPSDEVELASMLLGVTGVLETLQDGRVVNRRIVADFCTDLTAGLAIWRRDACTSLRARSRPTSGDRLPAGTYVLPLSMRIPCSDRLPPSFESRHFRLAYSMTLALVASPALGAEPKSQSSIIVRASVPFHVLPSTLPSMPPRLSPLDTDHRHGLTASAASLLGAAGASALGFGSTSEHTYRVQPRMPTSHYTPGGVIPIELLVSPPPGIGPGVGAQIGHDMFIRLTLKRRLYHRVASSSLNLKHAADDVWGAMLLSEELAAIRPHMVEEVNVPGSETWCCLDSSAMRTAGGGPRRLVGVIPLGLLPGGQSVWAHGYSLTLDLAANAKPAGDGGSWFRPSQAIARELERETRTAGQHVYASTRFFIAFEVGLAPAGSLAPYFRGGRFSEAGTACPFASHGASASSSIPGAARFTGKLREQLIVRDRHSRSR